MVGDYIKQSGNCYCIKIEESYTESLKGFEMKPLWVFSDSPRDKNFRGFPYE